MASVQRVALGAVAYSKMVLHALKHPQNSVCGLLVGADDGEAGKRTVACTDAFPLLHSHFLHPQMRLGLELVEEFCALYNETCAEEAESAETADPSAEGKIAGKRSGKAVKEKKVLKIVGFYYSEVPESQQGPHSSRVFSWLTQVISSAYPDLVVCSVHLRGLAEETASVAKMWVGAEDGRWRQLDEASMVMSNASRTLAREAVEAAKFSFLCDLDDHLADCTVSPVNEDLFAEFADLVGEDARHLCASGVSFLPLGAVNGKATDFSKFGVSSPAKSDRVRRPSDGNK